MREHKFDEDQFPCLGSPAERNAPIKPKMQSMSMKSKMTQSMKGGKTSSSMLGRIPPSLNAKTQFFDFKTVQYIKCFYCTK